MGWNIIWEASYCFAIDFIIRRPKKAMLNFVRNPEGEKSGNCLPFLQGASYFCFCIDKAENQSLYLLSSAFFSCPRKNPGKNQLVSRVLFYKNTLAHNHIYLLRCFHSGSLSIPFSFFFFLFLLLSNSAIAVVVAAVSRLSSFFLLFL